MNLMDKLRKARQDPIAALGQLGGSVRRQLPRFQVTRFYRHDARMPIPEIPPPSPIILDVLDPARSEVPELRGTSPKELRIRFDRGDRCYLATLNGQVVLYGWLQLTGRHPIEPAGRAYTLQPGEGLIYDGFADQAAYRRAAASVERGTGERPRRQRGTGICAPMVTRMLRDAHGMGITTVWTYHTLDNVVSQRCQLRGGMVPAYELRALTVGPFTLPVRSPRRDHG